MQIQALYQYRGQGQSANTYFKNNSSEIFSCIRTSANTGPTCILAKINSSRIFSCMYRFCAGGYYPCQGLGIFRQGKSLLENWPRLRERSWIFSPETATAFLSFSLRVEGSLFGILQNDLRFRAFFPPFPRILGVRQAEEILAFLVVFLAVFLSQMALQRCNVNFLARFLG